MREGGRAMAQLALPARPKLGALVSTRGDPQGAQRSMTGFVIVVISIVEEMERNGADLFVRAQRCREFLRCHDASHDAQGRWIARLVRR